MAILETIIAVIAGREATSVVSNVTSIVHSTIEILHKLMTFAAIAFILCTFVYYYFYPIPVTELFAEKIFGNPTCTASLFGVNYCLFPSNNEILGIISPYKNIMSLLGNGTFNIDLLLNIINAVLAIISGIWVLVRALIGLNLIYMIFKVLWGVFMFYGNYSQMYSY